MAAEASEPIPEPTVKEMRYGDHERHVIDYWQAKSDRPAPLLVVIHGGGWRAGDKDSFMQRWHHETLPWMLERGVSVAAINYRLSTDAPLPAPVHDAARAIQFLRSKAGELGFDPARVGLAGASAGGCTSLWLATHDDLAEPESDDPVARESTRVRAAWVHVAQSSVDPKQIEQWFGELEVTHEMIHLAAGFKDRDEMKAGYEEKAALYRAFSAINHLSADDPPMLLTYRAELDSRKDLIHHPLFGHHFKLRADEVGAPCILDLTPNEKSPEWKQWMLDILAAD